MIGTIESASQKTYEKTHNMPKSEIRLKSSVYTLGHLRSFGGHLVTSNDLKSEKHNLLSVPKHLWKDE